MLSESYLIKEVVNKGQHDEIIYSYFNIILITSAAFKDLSMKFEADLIIFSEVFKRM